MAYFFFKKKASEKVFPKFLFVLEIALVLEKAVFWSTDPFFRILAAMLGLI